MGVWVTVVLIGAIALPSLARKKKVQPAGQQQQTVRVDSLSPNNRKRYEYFLTEAQLATILLPSISTNTPETSILTRQRQIIICLSI